MAELCQTNQQWHTGYHRWLHPSPRLSELLSVVCVNAKFICRSHMWSINISIRKKSVGDFTVLMPSSSSLPVHTKQQMSTSWLCVCVMEWGIIIKNDLTDERVLRCLLYCHNRQLSLIITINRTVHLLRFLFPSLMVVWWVYVCVHLHRSTLIWLTSSALLPLSTLPDLVPSNSLCPPDSCAPEL